MVPVTVDPSSPVTVRSFMVAENRVTVTGSAGATSVEPNLGLELTRTLVFSAVDSLVGAADWSRPETVTGAPAVEVTVTTTSPWEPQALTASSVANASAIQPTRRRADHRVRLARSDRRNVRRTARSLHQCCPLGLLRLSVHGKPRS